MARNLAAVVGLGSMVALWACGGTSCESLQSEAEEIGREIQSDPSLAMDSDTQERLEEIQSEMQEMGCFGQ